MKIGIITFHWADNFGAVLQTFGLYQKLTELFTCDDIYIVDYKPDVLFKGGISGLIKYFLKMIIHARNRMYFRNFVKKHFKLIKIEDINNLDCLVCGSDQIWNIALIGRVIPQYFGNIKGFAGKIITYAVSDGGGLEGEMDNALLKKYIFNISAVSVREKTMMPFLSNFKKNIQVVLDPTFLPEEEFWKSFLSMRKCKKEYILIYRLGKDKKLLEDAKYLSRQEKIEIMEVTTAPYIKRFLEDRVNVVSNPNIPDFLSYIYLAKYIFTNSFHGTAFSIIFNINFWVYTVNSSNNNRIHNLLCEFGLVERYGHYFSLENIKDIDYSSINDIIKKRREESALFLKDSICH